MLKTAPHLALSAAVNRALAEGSPAIVEIRVTYCARVSARNGRALYQSGPHETREGAILEAFAARPAAKECSTGYGFAGGFDIRWHKRSELEGA